MTCSSSQVIIGPETSHWIKAAALTQKKTYGKITMLAIVFALVKTCTLRIIVIYVFYSLFNTRNTLLLPL